MTHEQAGRSQDSKLRVNQFQGKKLLSPLQFRNQPCAPKTIISKQQVPTQRPSFSVDPRDLAILHQDGQVDTSRLNNDSKRASNFENSKRNSSAEANVDNTGQTRKHEKNTKDQATQPQYDINGCSIFEIDE